MRTLLTLLLVIALLLIGAWYLLAPVGPTQETFVEIPTGTPTAKIAELLEQQGIIRSRYAFELWRLTHHGTLKAGEYRFDHKSPLPEVYNRIRRGDVYTRAVTIPEGFNIFDIAQAVEAAGLGTRQTFLDAARQNTSLIAALDPQATSLEGYLFPDTYHFQRKDAAPVILAAMVKRFRQAAAQIGLKSDYRKTVTLASLVERETPVATDRPLIAGVFTNRLEKGIPLATDPSIIYAALLENRFRGTIYASDLAAESRYNTYKHTGLPPGPICNPGLASLKAAMEPAKTDYLYFVVDPANPGHSKFATTLEQHNRNVAEYRAGAR